MLDNGGTVSGAWAGIPACMAKGNGEWKAVGEGRESSETAESGVDAAGRVSSEAAAARAGASVQTSFPMSMAGGR